VVVRRFVFGDAEREHFRMCMRMQENFSGCRVLSYCVISNHFQIPLEVPPMPEDGISGELLLKRLLAIQTEVFVAGVAKELDEARKAGREDGVAGRRGMERRRWRGKITGRCCRIWGWRRCFAAG
jgi:hypothetical protein